MRALLLLTFLLSISNSPRLGALELYTKTAAGDAPANWTYIYSEDNRWIVEELALDAAGWPVIKARHIYGSEKLARVAFLAITATGTKAAGIPESGGELADPAGDTLWTVTNQWSWDWEIKYSEWVKSELDSGWWKRHGLATDCADVAYSARWIFARNNGLPMANRLGNGQWFTYKSVKPEWKRLPHAAEWYNDKKFLAGLNYFLDFVFTHSLWKDSYPIEINAESLRPGAHHLALHDRTGHTQLVYRVGLQPDEIPVATLNSTVPREVRELWEYMFYNTRADENSEAFLRIRWPKWTANTVSLVDAAQMPHYSKEQFDPAFVRTPREAFWEEVFFRLNPYLDMERVAIRGLTQVADLMRARIQVVEDGYQACSGGRCPEGSALWETWSTPTRDERISSAISLFQMVDAKVQDKSHILPILRSDLITLEGYTFTLEQMISAWRFGFFSSDPGDEPVMRWGAHPRGASLKILNQVSLSLSEREKKIAAGSSCKTVSCTFGSEKYNRESSFEIDKRIWFAADLPGYYCQALGRDLCKDFRNFLDQLTLTSNGRTQGIRRWLEEGSYFNSDPRNTVSRRYLSYTRDIPHFDLKLGSVRRVDEYNGEMILTTGYDEGFSPYGDQKLYVLNGLDFQEWSAPAGETLIALDTVEGWIWSIQSTTLFARKIDSVQTLAYPLSGQFGSLLVRNGHAILVESTGAKILTVEATGITGVNLDPAFKILDTETHPGYLMLEGPGGTLPIYDLDQAQMLDIPVSTHIASIHRMPGGLHTLRYYRPDGQGYSCAIVSKDAPIQLNVDADCILADPSGYAILSVNGELIKRSFNNWHFAGDTNLGEILNLQTNRLYRVLHRGQEIYYCANSNGVVALPSLANGMAYYECNNRFAGAYMDGQPWRVIDIASGNTLFEVKGWAVLASADLNEHYFLVTKEVGGRETALMDLSHLEKFSMLSDFALYTFQNFRTERKNGLVVYKNGKGIWIKDPI